MVCNIFSRLSKWTAVVQARKLACFIFEILSSFGSFLSKAVMLCMQIPGIGRVSEQVGAAESGLGLALTQNQPAPVLGCCRYCPPAPVFLRALIWATRGTSGLPTTCVRPAPPHRCSCWARHWAPGRAGSCWRSARSSRRSSRPPPPTSFWAPRWGWAPRATRRRSQRMSCRARASGGGATSGVRDGGGM